MDAIGETGSVCASTDSSHFQNLNGSLGSLAEVVSMSQSSANPYTVMTGLGANGTAGVKSSSATTAAWPQILSGEGGPVAIDPTAISKWYVNNGAGVSIHLCEQADACTPADFGAGALINNADVNNDGLTMTTPAPFMVDPLDPTQLLIGTCRVWRGPADGLGWNTSNAISQILDDLTSSGPCSGDALIRSMAAAMLPGGTEVVYVGMYGSADGGGNLAGHVFGATINPASSSVPVWQDLTLNPVANNNAMNALGLDISSIFIDPLDLTGNTVYVTVAQLPIPTVDPEIVYRSTNGGASWLNVTGNLPWAPANSVVVDPQDPNTVYVATDVGVYSTRQIANCPNASLECWSAFGTGLPEAPVVQISAALTTAAAHVLTAATYGRGVWQIPLWTANENLTIATASPTSLTFPSQAEESPSNPQTVTLTNTGASALMPTSVTASEAFSETDNCLSAILNAGAGCSIQVTFVPTAPGPQTGQLTIGANVAGGEVTVALSGTGVAAGSVTLSPPIVSFGPVTEGTTSSSQPIAVSNSSANAVAVTSLGVTPPFAIASNSCGSSLTAGVACQLKVDYAPTQLGMSTGTLTLIDALGTQTVQLNGTGTAPATDTLSTTSLSFPSTMMGQTSAAQIVSLVNSGAASLTSIATSVTGPFQVSNNCGTILAPNSSCAISVVFLPTLAATQTGLLTVSDILKTQTVTLSGTGLLPPALSISPSQLTFPAVITGQSSTAQTVTITDTGGIAANSLTLVVSSQFSLTQNTCSSSLAAGASCSTGVVFTPTASGAVSGTLTASSTSLTTPAIATLSGTGEAPADFTITVSGSSSQTVVSGQTASYSLVIAPSNGMQGAFTFQCGTVPSYTSCTFSPASISISAGATGSVTVNVATGQSTSVANATGASGWRMLPLGCGLILLPLGWRRRRKALLLVALLTILVGSVSSCAGAGGGTGGGGGGGSTGGDTTPSGTYSIPITMTSNTVQHTVTLTLTVD
jgi:hypothetical protein